MNSSADLKILILDNYDSFTYNLFQYIREITPSFVEVKRNDKITVQEAGEYDILILSPGPGLPSAAGNMMAILKAFLAEKPILGVCLGHQAIGETCNAKLINLPKVYHGVSSLLEIPEYEGLFKGVPPDCRAGRYHSWTIQKDSLPPDLIPTAYDENGEIMAMKHRIYPVFGVQFHPESVMTPDGKKMLENFMETAQKHVLEKLQIPE